MRSACVIIRIVGVRFPRSWFEHVGIGRIRSSDGAWHTINHPLLRAIGIHGANNVSARIVVKSGLSPDLPIGWYCIGPARGEKRFVLFDHVALVVIDLPSADNHKRITGRCLLSN